MKKAVDIFRDLYYTTLRNRGVAQFGRALRSGRRGRKFESCRLDFKACWSSGQDDALSRRKPGFDSRTGHLLLHINLQQHFLQSASVAQSVEQRIRNAWVGGSSPPGSFLEKPCIYRAFSYFLNILSRPEWAAFLLLSTVCRPELFN